MKITLKDGKMMFENCILLFNGEPYYVRQLTEDQAGLYAPKKGSRQEVVSHEEYEAFSPIKSRLGYVNNPDLSAAFFLSRNPVRQFKVGICLNNLAVTGDEALIEQFGEMFPNWTGLDDCLHSSYPSLTEAYYKIVKGWSSVAFDKQFCVDKNFDVMYKGQSKVGKLNLDRLKIHWKRGYEFLNSVVTNV